jgi:hypothetical protein
MLRMKSISEHNNKPTEILINRKPQTLDYPLEQVHINTSEPLLLDSNNVESGEYEFDGQKIVPE